ncbi:putative NmrA-like family domain-containing protein 1, partial [Lentithecium fluviatile CBS 122367]
RKVLITGATGKQGGALLNALISRPNGSPFHIYALTRDKNTKSAQALAQSPNVSIIQGDLDDCPAILKQIQDPWGVFSVQLPLPNATVEERRGKALVDAAAAAGVKYFVYTSAERGGVKRSDWDTTNVAHFKSKFNIEKNLKEATATRALGMSWTIIRPVAFYENLTPDFIGKAFATMWKQVGDKKVQFVSSTDVGRVAALAFENPEKYRGQAISLAGDELTQTEAAAIFKKQTGSDMPETFGFVGSVIKVVLQEQLGDMFVWFKEKGFGADVAALKKEYPFLMDFRMWLEKESKF